jgi:LAO/AO transport system kinase
MATRGQLGGLGKTTREAVLVFDAMGYDVIVIETVGVGQDEVEIAQLAHTTAVVCLPGMGDEVQAMKAGLLEIGDVFVVNKGDLNGADDVVETLQSMLGRTAAAKEGWLAPVLKTVAVKAQGIPELVAAFQRHRRFLMSSGAFLEHNFQWEFQVFRRHVMLRAAEKIFGRLEDSPLYSALLEDLKARRIDPMSAAEKMLQMYNESAELRSNRLTRL